MTLNHDFKVNFNLEFFRSFPLVFGIVKSGEEIFWWFWVVWTAAVVPGGGRIEA